MANEKKQPGWDAPVTGPNTPYYEPLPNVPATPSKPWKMPVTIEKMPGPVGFEVPLFPAKKK